MLELQFFILHYTALTDLHAFGVYIYVNEPIEYQHSQSFLVFIICNDILAKCKTNTSVLNVPNSFYMQPCDENNDLSCIYFRRKLI